MALQEHACMMFQLVQMFDKAAFRLVQVGLVIRKLTQSAKLCVKRRVNQDQHIPLLDQLQERKKEKD